MKKFNAILQMKMSRLVIILSVSVFQTYGNLAQLSPTNSKYQRGKRAMRTPSLFPPTPVPPSLSLTRRNLLLTLSLSIPWAHLSVTSPSHSRGLFRMPPPRLVNRYFLVRSGESTFETAGVIRTNPVSKTSVDSGLSVDGLRQTAQAALELKRLGACEDDCWIWPSITQRSYQAAEIIAYVNEVNHMLITV